MATLLIDGRIDRTISRINNQIKGASKEEKEELEYKLKLAESYRERKKLDLEYYEISKIKFSNPNKYIKKVKDLIKQIPGVSYSKRDDNFCVRVSRKSKRIYLGSYKKISDAIDTLNEFNKISPVIVN